MLCLSALAGVKRFPAQGRAGTLYTHFRAFKGKREKILDEMS
jgi:hypothetical protein